MLIKRVAVFIFKGLRRVRYPLFSLISTLVSKIMFWLNGASVGSIVCYGVPYIHVSLKGKLKIGRKLHLNNWIAMSETGLISKCRIEVLNNASLIIKDNVGMSSVSISCFESIYIGNNVKIGVGVHIYDTDFHSLNPIERRSSISDTLNMRTGKIVIEDDVFIGAFSLILKNVTIGANSILGAGSVLTKSIPPNEIWAGNPACFIRKI